MVNETSVIDVNTTPFEEIEKLPDFLREKMKASEEYAGRVSHSANVSGEVTAEAGPKEKLQKPKILGGQYPSEDINPDDVPF